MKKKLLALTTASVLSICVNLSAFAASIPSVSWTDWSSFSPASSSALGSMDFDLLGTVDVTLSGDFFNGEKGTTYYAPYSSTYADLKPFDLIREIGVSTITLNFSKAVTNPYIALVSVGQGGYPVTYAFQNQFEVISSGGNDWGYQGFAVDGVYSNSIFNNIDNHLTPIIGTSFAGYEYNGILRFNGTYDSLKFDILQSEGWHSFTIGSEGIATPAPEPSSMILGLMGLGSILRRRKRR